MTRCHFRDCNAGLATAGVLILLLAAVDAGLNVSLAAEISFQIMTDKDAPGNDYKRLRGVTVETCKARCLEDSRCAAFTYNQRRRYCFLKDQADPPLKGFRGAVTGLKQVRQEPEPEPESPAPVTKDDAASPEPGLPDKPVISLEPKTEPAPTAEGCTMFDNDFALIRNPNVILRFDRVKGDAAEAQKARMSFYDQGSKVLSGSLRLEANQFRFVEDSAAADSEASTGRGVTILDRNNPSGNSMSDPVFVVVDRLPFDGGVFRRVECPDP